MMKVKSDEVKSSFCRKKTLTYAAVLYLPSFFSNNKPFLKTVNKIWKPRPETARREHEIQNIWAPQADKSNLFSWFGFIKLGET